VCQAEEIQQLVALTSNAAPNDLTDSVTNGTLSPELPVDKQLLNGWHQPLCVYEPADFNIAVGPVFNFISGMKFCNNVDVVCDVFSGELKELWKWPLVPTIAQFHHIDSMEECC
jgi:hypothetical protein